MTIRAPLYTRIPTAPRGLSLYDAEWGNPTAGVLSSGQQGATGPGPAASWSNPTLSRDPRAAAIAALPGVWQNRLGTLLVEQQAPAAPVFPQLWGNPVFQPLPPALRTWTSQATLALNASTLPPGRRALPEPQAPRRGQGFEARVPTPILNALVLPPGKRELAQPRAIAQGGRGLDASQLSIALTATPPVEVAPFTPPIFGNPFTRFAARGFELATPLALAAPPVAMPAAFGWQSTPVQHIRGIFEWSAGTFYALLDVPTPTPTPTPTPAPVELEPAPIQTVGRGSDYDFRARKGEAEEASLLAIAAFLTLIDR